MDEITQPKREEIVDNNEVTKEATNQALTVLGKANAIRVVDNETMTAADDLIKSMRLVRKEIGLAFDPIIKKAFEAHKEAKSQKDRAELPLIKAEEFLKPQIKNYLTEQDRLRREEENKRRLEAQKVEEDSRVKEAVQLEAEGHSEEAVAVLESPAPIVMPAVERTTPKVDMRLYKKVWKFRIINEEQIPREYMIPNEGAIGAVVKRLQGKCKIPGIQVYQE